jgi:putative methionine-R-sulfoxide reductase with GAF domain
MAITGGGCLGVLTGCLIGMSCLFFIDTGKADRLKKANELTSIFKSVMEDGHLLVNAERATIWIYEKKEGVLWSRVATGEKDEIRISAAKGVAGYCARHGEIINIYDAYADDRFNRDVDKLTGFRTKSIIAVPVKNNDGEVLGVIQMINKKCPDMSDGHFDENDVKLLGMLANHVKTFIDIVEG